MLVVIDHNLIFLDCFILNCYRSSKQFKICFGISVEVFDSILATIGPQMNQKSLTAAANEKLQSGAPRSLKTAEDIMKLFFHWLRHYPTEELLAVQLECSPSTVEKYLNFAKEIFLYEYEHNNPVIFLPGRRDRDRKSIIVTLPNGRMTRLSVLIDGTYAAILQPIKGIQAQPVIIINTKGTTKASNQAYFSGKAHIYSCLFQLCCAPTDGSIYTLSFPERGGFNDTMNYDKEDNQIHRKLDHDEGIGADAIYSYISNEYKHNTITTHGRLGAKGDRVKTLWNNYFAQYRTMVENVFAHMKQWKICAQIFRHQRESLRDVWMCAAILTQMKAQKTNGIRGLKWIVKLKEGKT
jgi:hypothetical protein